jgi:hypothetical protein
MLPAGSRQVGHNRPPNIHSKTILTRKNSKNSNNMRKAFLLAITAALLAGPIVYANGGKAKKQDCTHCTKQNCTGQKCDQCCKNGQCKKG